MNNSNINAFNRIKLILNSSFLSYFFTEKESWKTWKFWFFINTIITLIITIVFSVGINSGINEFRSDIWNNIPEFQTDFKDGKLDINQIEQPYVHNEDGFLFVVDTKSEIIDESIFNENDQLVYITSSKAVVKKSEFETREFVFAKIEEDFSFSKIDINNWFIDNLFTIKLIISIVAFFGIWFALNIFRLLTAAWWALIFWVFGLMFKVEKLDFGTAYLSVLNFYFIPCVFEYILLKFNIFIPFSTFMIFGFIFGVNFWNIKRVK